MSGSSSNPRAQVYRVDPGHRHPRCRAERPYSLPDSATRLPVMQTYEIHAQTRPVQPTAVAKATLAVCEIGPWLGKVYGEIADVLTDQGQEMAGPPFAWYHPLADGRHDVEAGFPVTTPIEPVGQVRASTLSGGPVAMTMHVGPYEAMKPAYAALASWVDDQGGEPTGDAWEIYFSDPQQQPDPSGWRTQIVQPYRLR